MAKSGIPKRIVDMNIELHICEALFIYQNSSLEAALRTSLHIVSGLLQETTYFLPALISTRNTWSRSDAYIINFPSYLLRNHPHHPIKPPLPKVRTQSVVALQGIVVMTMQDTISVLQTIHDAAKKINYTHS